MAFESSSSSGERVTSAGQCLGIWGFTVVKSVKLTCSAVTTEASASLTGSSRHVTVPLSSLTCFPAGPCPWHGTPAKSKIQSSLELCSLRVLSWARPQLLCPLAEEQEPLHATKEAPLTLTLCLK